MTLTSTDQIYAQVVHVQDERLDASIAIQFKEEFRAITGTGDDVILDLSKVEFLDSSGLGAIVAVYKGLEDGRAMALAGLQPTVEKVMTLTRMNSVFAMFATVEDAVLAASGQTAAE